ncbi:MAG: hypothetical protein H6741_00920 [Alphaproteobacteria bacterium]|nr:hypothetical protein [Alphaproteobacteria bacterium]
MRPIELLILYALLGACVAVAWQRSGRSGAITVLPLWPLFVPTLVAAAAPVAPSSPAPLARGPWGRRIQEAVASLERALVQWQALPDAAHFEASLRSAQRGLCALAERHGQLSEVLETPENDSKRLCVELESCAPAARPLLEARLANVQRLEALRDEAAEELERALAGLSDLSTKVHLARFTGDAAQELTAQLARLAAAVDGASEVARIGRA